MSQGDRQGPSPAEQLARAGAEKAIWKLVAWIGGGTVALVVLFIVIFAAVAIYLGGGMPGLTGPGVPPQVGTAQSRPTMWLDARAVVHSSLPNVVILAVMEHESRGQVFARNYNCTFGLTSPKRCSQTYLGGVIHTKSEDAGLMGINSGGWPQTPKWQALGFGQDPFNPQKNIAAGVAELQADMAKYHYLKYALEAYNSGSGGPNSTDAAYALAVLKDIQTYEAGPTLALWSPQPAGAGVYDPLAKGPIQSYSVSGQYTPYWIVVEAAGPYGAIYSIPWAPQPPRCETKSGKTTCTPQPPITVSGHALVPPNGVTATTLASPSSLKGCNGCRVPMSTAAPDAPVWPGAQVWAVQQSVRNIWSIAATWPPHHSAIAYVGFVPPGKGP